MDAQEESGSQHATAEGTAAPPRRRWGPRPLAGLTAQNFARETLAGVTLLAIAVPLNVGYAQIAGLPATAGLYAMVVPLAVYALMVTSRQVVASPDAAAAALVASSIGGLAVAGSADYMVLAGAQALLSGLMFVLASVLKLGFLADFLSKPILVGFVGGLALDILISQVAKMLGISLPSGAEFLEKLGALATGLPALHPWSLVVALLALAILLGGRRLAPSAPWALIVLVVATVVTAAAGLDGRGVAVLGPMDAGGVPLGVPRLSLGEWLALVPSALALTMVTMAEGLLVARSYAQRRHYPITPDRDVLALGAANVAAGVTGGFAVGSSTSRTAAMDQAGSRTQWPSLVAGTGTLLLLLCGTGLLERLPSPAIGAIVGVAVLPLLGVGELRELWSRDRGEFLVGAMCFATTLLIGAIPGILVAFVLALVNLARRAAAPAIDVLDAGDDPAQSLLIPAPHGRTTAPGVVVVRVAAPLFFANSAVVDAAIRRSVTASPEPVRRLVLDLEAVTDVDVTAAGVLERLLDWLAEQDVEVSLSRARPQLLERLHRLGVGEDLDVHSTNRDALAAYGERAPSPAADGAVAVDGNRNAQEGKPAAEDGNRSDRT